MKLAPEDIAKIKRVARLADGTEFEGERTKSIAVCLNILKEKGGMSFLQIMEVVLDGTGKAKSTASGSSSPPWQEKKQGTAYHPGVDWFEEFLRQQRESNERHRKAEEEYKQAKAKAEEAEKRRKEQAISVFYAHTCIQLNDMMWRFFEVYKVERQKAEINKGMVDFCIQYSVRQSLLGMRGSYASDNLVALRDTEAAFLADLEQKEGFQLFLSEKQFEWLVQIYRKVREHMRLKDVSFHPKFQYEKDILYKSFTKFGIPYLKVDREGNVTY